MQKGWSLFFGVVLFATFIIWFAAPFFGWWLPENISTLGAEADRLFYLILGATAFFFVLTEVILVYALWRFGARDGEKSTYVHGNHRLEMLWTAVPAAILLFIAFSQIGSWMQIKYTSQMPSPDLTVSVTARQWEWRMRYPADAARFHYDADEGRSEKTRLGRAWAERPEADDIHVPNELHAWKNANVKLWLRTVDVLHSFTLPNLRLKQDTLPGRTIPMWFRANRGNARFGLFKDGKEVPVKLDDAGVITEPANLLEHEGRIIESGNRKDAWEIACQELCGTRHYAMRGRLYVHESKASYQTWLQYSRARQQARTLEGSVALGN